MDLTTPYAFGKTVDISCAEVQRKVREALANEGFGVLAEIDLSQKFSEKLQKEFRDYIILGACNPSLAYEALQNEINVGVLLPCNVIIYTRNDGKTAVMFMDPIARFSSIGNPEIEAFGISVTEKLERVLDAI
jgi:uncharacterized protein (DUF302 family)